CLLSHLGNVGLDQADLAEKDGKSGNDHKPVQAGFLKLDERFVGNEACYDDQESGNECQNQGEIALHGQLPPCRNCFNQPHPAISAITPVRTRRITNSFPKSCPFRLPSCWGSRERYAEAA